MGSTPVVGRLKYLLKPFKIGHAGTLDPLATGVLPIALGKATRLIPFVMDGKKIYEFTVRWGVQTDSDDLAGQEIARNDIRPTQEQILSVLPKFIGTIMQKPSIYSALKINGQRAYDLARSGQDVQIQPRPTQIYDLKLLNHDGETSSFVAEVGKGTYIRTLAHDIAESVGALGVVIRLHRTKDGPFDINQAVALDDNMEKNIQPMEKVLGNLSKLNVSSDVAKRLLYGQRIKDEAYADLSGIYAVMFENQLVALGEVEKNVLHPRSIFATKED